tara:strand:- start:220 stop:456 length:237 start_codon:yes stop_codon:yes gene_type:complete
MRIEHVSDGFVKVHKVSILSGKESSMVLPTRQGNLEHWIDTGALVQDMFPHFNVDQLEFLISGITPEEWDETFGSEDI